MSLPKKVVSTFQKAINTLYLHGSILAIYSSRRNIKGCYHYYSIFPELFWRFIGGLLWIVRLEDIPAW